MQRTTTVDARGLQARGHHFGRWAPVRTLALLAAEAGGALSLMGCPAATGLRVYPGPPTLGAARADECVMKPLPYSREARIKLWVEAECLTVDTPPLHVTVDWKKRGLIREQDVKDVRLWPMRRTELSFTIDAPGSGNGPESVLVYVSATCDKPAGKKISAKVTCEVEGRP